MQVTGAIVITREVSEAEAVVGVVVVQGNSLLSVELATKQVTFSANVQNASANRVEIKATMVGHMNVQNTND